MVKKFAAKSRPRRTATLLPVTAIFLLALVLRLIYVIQARANPQFAAPLMDPEIHDGWAWQMASGTYPGGEPFFRAPLYPFFLSAIYMLGGHDFLLPRLVQAVLGSASCVLIYLIGARLFTRAAGLLAGLGAAVYWVLIYFDNELLIPVLLVLLTLAFFYTLLRALEPWLGDAPPTGHLAGWAGISGLLFGLAAITRPSILIFLPAVGWGFWRARRYGLTYMAAGAFIALALIPIGGTTLYNAVAGDDFVLIASQGGVNFYIGNNPQSDGTTAIVPGTRGDWWGGRYDTIKIAERAAGRELKDSAVSAYWFRRATDFIREQPLDWLRLTLRKLGLFWTAAEMGNNSSIYHLRGYAGLMRLPLLGFGVVAPLGLAGICLALCRRRRAAFLPALFVGLYMAGVVAFFVCARFRVPVMPFLLIFAGYAVAESRTAWRRREAGGRRTAGLTVALAILLALPVNLAARSHRENIAQARFHDGVAWSRQGKLEAAEQALRDALRLDPELDGARSNLANLLAARGDGAAARASYERALMANPRNAKTWANLASLYLDEGHLAAADSAAQRALAIDPDYSEALRVQGVIREAQGDLAGAREAYTRALAYTQSPHRVENNLGLLALKENDPLSAELHLRRATELDPSYAMAWGNLALLLVNSGRVAEAVEPLRRVTALQPHRREVWLDLARVMEHLGRREEAQAARRRAAEAGTR